MGSQSEFQGIESIMQVKIINYKYKYLLYNTHCSCLDNL